VVGELHRRQLRAVDHRRLRRGFRRGADRGLASSRRCSPRWSPPILSTTTSCARNAASSACRRAGRGEFRGARPARAAASRAGGGRHRRPRPERGFNSARRFGYVRDNFTRQRLMETLPGRWPSAMCAIPPPAPRARPRSATCSPSSASSPWAARRSRITATSPTPTRCARTDRARLDLPVLLGQRMHHPPDGPLDAAHIPERMKDALRRVEGAFSVVAMTRPS
jgi:hypothetical protein